MDRQELLKSLNGRQLLVGWFHAYLKEMEQEYQEFEQELNRRGL